MSITIRQAETIRTMSSSAPAGISNLPTGREGIGWPSTQSRGASSPLALSAPCSLKTVLIRVPKTLTMHRPLLALIGGVRGPLAPEHARKDTRGPLGVAGAAGGC